MTDTTSESGVSTCTCKPESGCDGEGYDADDPRTCVYCRDVDGEMPCPADPSTYDATVEWVMDALCESVESGESVFAPNVVCADGTEPFASMDIGGGLVLDLTAKLRRVSG